MLLLSVVHRTAPAKAQSSARFAPSHLLPVDAGPGRASWTAAPRHPLAFDSERAYAALRTDRLVALDLATGEQLWAVEQRLDHPPVAGDGVVAGVSGSSVSSRRASDGAVLWNAHLDSPIVAPPLWNTGWLVVANRGPDRSSLLRSFDGREIVAPRP